MITKFARLEFDLFTKPSISDFLRVPQPIAIKIQPVEPVVPADELSYS